MKRMKLFLTGIIILILTSPFYAQESVSPGVKKKNTVVLDLNRAVDYLLRNNDDIKLALLNYKGANNSIQQFRAKYDVVLFAGAGWNHKNVNADNALNIGTWTIRDTNWGYNWNVGVQKLFRSGTSITASISNLYQYGADGPSLSMGGTGYQSKISFEIAQEVLKNTFGQVDRLQEKSLKYNSLIVKNSVKLQLSKLLLDAIVGFWNVTIAEENLKTGRESLRSTINIRNLIIRKQRLGLSEREEIFDWNGKVVQGKTNIQTAEKMLFDARTAVRSVLNLGSNTNFTVTNSFITTAPDVSLSQAFTDAFSKRVDWVNQKIKLRQAVIQYKIAQNGLLPSLKLKVTGSTANEDEEYGNTYQFYPEIKIGAEFSYPLGDTGGNAKVREARLNLMKEKVTLQKLEQDIKDEISTAIKKCEVTYNIYQQSKKARIYTQHYYNQVYTKFRRGRYSAVQLKMALDSYIQAQYMELKSLVDYNTALVGRDFSRNVLFERFNVDLNYILKRLEK